MHSYKDHLGPMLGSAHQLCRQTLDRSLREYELTPAQAFAMVYLSHEVPKREVNQRDLEEHFHVKPSTVNGILERLEQKGFICRAPSPTDGRRRSITVTDKGRSFESSFSDAVEDAEARVCAVFTEEELQALKRLLRKLTEQVQSEELKP